jgi:hopanoid biosynthesis associated radical SAM protein HpnH
MARPKELAARLSWYMLTNRLVKRVKRFPLVTMLEPLEACNLTCEGCGRLREYESVLHRRLTPDECMAVVEESGAPIVSVTGGEPTIHPQIAEIVTRIVLQKRFVYLCTNGLMMTRVMEELPPSKYLCWVVHMDGTAERHDRAVRRQGVYAIARAAIEKAIARGYRVCTNTTLFHGSDPDDLHTLWRELTQLGFEGAMVSPAYEYQAVPDQQLFLLRNEAIEVFRKVLDPARTADIRLYNNPLYLEFLRGERQIPACMAWATPTYTVMGWRNPCYALADSHSQRLSDLMEDDVWDRYGDGDRDRRCTNCMMHSGFEPATLLPALGSLREAAELVRAGVSGRSGAPVA